MGSELKIFIIPLHATPCPKATGLETNLQTAIMLLGREGGREQPRRGEERGPERAPLGPGEGQHLLQKFYQGRAAQEHCSSCRGSGQGQGHMSYTGTPGQ